MESKRERTLLDYFEASPLDISSFRPIMTSLNGDNSWLLSFPSPLAEQSLVGKVYYHIVFEPWLNCPTGYLNSWFIHIQQLTISAVADAHSVDAVARRIESLARAALGAALSIGEDPECEQSHPIIDAILLGFHYPDHVHEATLRLFDGNIPVFATPEAIAIIKP